jgi:hypothetical protein
MSGNYEQRRTADDLECHLADQVERFVSSLSAMLAVQMQPFDERQFLSKIKEWVDERIEMLNDEAQMAASA